MFHVKHLPQLVKNDGRLYIFYVKVSLHLSAEYRLAWQK